MGHRKSNVPMHLPFFVTVTTVTSEQKQWATTSAVTNTTCTFLVVIIIRPWPYTHESSLQREEKSTTQSVCGAKLIYKKNRDGIDKYQTCDCKYSKSASIISYGKRHKLHNALRNIISHEKFLSIQVLNQY